MSRTVQFGIVLGIIWLIGLPLLWGSTNHDVREFAGLWTLLPVWGPLLVIALLTSVVWVLQRLGFDTRPRH
jgi:hypothetical protein